MTPSGGGPEKIAELLIEAAEEIEAGIRERYGDPPHPAYDRKVIRDSELPEQLRALVRSLVGEPGKQPECVLVSREDLERGKKLLRDVYADIKELADLEEFFDGWLSSVSTPAPQEQK